MGNWGVGGLGGLGGWGFGVFCWVARQGFGFQAMVRRAFSFGTLLQPPKWSPHIWFEPRAHFPVKTPVTDMPVAAGWGFRVLYWFCRLDGYRQAGPHGPMLIMLGIHVRSVRATIAYVRRRFWYRLAYWVLNRPRMCQANGR